MSQYYCKTFHFARGSERVNMLSNAAYVTISLAQCLEMETITDGAKNVTKTLLHTHTNVF
jgi:hypothetical protein